MRVHRAQQARGFDVYLHARLDPVHCAVPGLAAGLTLLISLALLAAWLLYFDQGAVRRMGFVYAERLFDCLPSLPSSAPRKRAPKPTTD